MRNELSDAIELGKIIAPYCFFGNFLDTYDPTRDYSANKVTFYGRALRYISRFPDSELAMALTCRGKLYRMSQGGQPDGSVPVSWASTDWMFGEYGCYEWLIKMTTDTKDGVGVSIEGLAKYLEAHGQDIHNIEFWTGTSPEDYFASHPLAERIATAWDSEGEVLFAPEPGEVEIVEADYDDD